MIINHLYYYRSKLYVDCLVISLEGSLVAIILELAGREFKLERYIFPYYGFSMVPLSSSNNAFFINKIIFYVCKNNFVFKLSTNHYQIRDP